MIVNDRKIYQEMKSNSLLSLKKLLQNEKKMPYYNYKKLFSSRKSGLLSASIFKSVILKSILNTFYKVLTKKVFLMKNRLKLNIKMFF